MKGPSLCNCWCSLQKREERRGKKEEQKQNHSEERPQRPIFWPHGPLRTVSLLGLDIGWSCFGCFCWHLLYILWVYLVHMFDILCVCVLVCVQFLCIFERVCCIFVHVWDIGCASKHNKKCQVNHQN